MKKQDYIDLYCTKYCEVEKNPTTGCTGSQSKCAQVKKLKKAFDAGYNQGRNDADASRSKVRKSHKLIIENLVRRFLKISYDDFIIL